jgi:3-methyladenine DNA glycosylase/8-oxoguanine DNA glycosylase
VSAATAGAPGAVRELRLEVEPPSPYRLPRRSSMDGLLRARAGVLHRLVHVDGARVHVRVTQLASGRVLFGAAAADPAHARWAIERMRIAPGVDHDLGEVHRRFRDDPLIGRALRADPGLRLRGRPDPFEALAWAITEQLIEFERAVGIQRRLVAALGRRCPDTGLRDSPAAAAVAAQAPARLESFGLSAGRALALRRAAHEVAAGRVDLLGPDHERGWQRLRAIPGIGSWTVEMLALNGQGRLDQLPAGDLGLLKLAGRLLTGDPRARATEPEVRALFAPYGRWQGLAAAYAFRSGGSPINALGGG